MGYHRNWANFKCPPWGISKCSQIQDLLFIDYVQLQAQVFTLTNITCFEILKTFGVPIDSAIICTQGSPQGVTQTTCSGDSGGPLMVQRNGTMCSNFVYAQIISLVPISGKFVHVGLTSFGLSLECTNDTPTMFARTTSILDWISATVSSSTDLPEEPFIPLLYRWLTTLPYLNLMMRNRKLLYFV